MISPKLLLSGHVVSSPKFPLSESLRQKVKLSSVSVFFSVYNYFSVL